jgi:mitochondrial ornithine carrier protein
MAENAILFLAYGELQSLIRVVGNVPVTQALSLPQIALAAAGAGSITSIVLCVLDLFLSMRNIEPDPDMLTIE